MSKARGGDFTEILLKKQIVSGGPWIDAAHLCRAACRGHRSPEERLHTVGFRVVLEVVPGMGT